MDYNHRDEDFQFRLFMAYEELKQEEVKPEYMDSELLTTLKNDLQYIITKDLDSSVDRTYIEKCILYFGEDYCVPDSVEISIYIDRINSILKSIERGD